MNAGALLSVGLPVSTVSGNNELEDPPLKPLNFSAKLPVPVIEFVNLLSCLLFGLSSSLLDCDMKLGVEPFIPGDFVCDIPCAFGVDYATRP